MRNSWFQLFIKMFHIPSFILFILIALKSSIYIWRRTPGNFPSICLAFHLIIWLFCCYRRRFSGGDAMNQMAVKKVSEEIAAGPLQILYVYAM